MQLFRLFLWLLALLSLVLAQCRTSVQSQMTYVDPIKQHTMTYVDSVEEHKRSATDFLWPANVRKHNPWPIFVRRNVPLRIVRYCFADARAKQMLCKTVQDALQIWADKIGYPHGAANGHNMAWEEARTNDPPGQRQNLFCYLDNANEDPENREWNPEVLDDTLKIDFDPDLDGASSTIGWRAKKGYSDDFGRHDITIGPGTLAFTVAHEVSRRSAPKQTWTKTVSSDMVGEGTHVHNSADKA
jgi:hypothetical protein